MDQHIRKGKDATDKMVAGATKLADIVTTTLGPDGKNVFLEHPNGTPLSTKDGAIVSHWVHLDDRFENMGARIVRFAGEKTAAEAGDATTTTTILAESFARNGVAAINNGANARNLIEGMVMAKDDIVKSLLKKAKPITSKSPMINKVAMVSSNYDKQLSSMITKVVKDAGKDVVVNIERSLGGLTEMDYQKGFTVPSSYAHPVFVNTPHNECILENVAIIICDYEVSKIKEVGHIFATIEGTNRQPGPGALLRSDGTRKKVDSYLFIAKEVQGEAMSSLAKSKTENNAPIGIAKAPTGDDFNEIIRDIALFTGGTVIAENEGMNMESMSIHVDCGWAEKIILSRDQLSIIDGQSNEIEVGNRLARLSNSEKEHKGTKAADVFKERAARLTGVVARMTVSGENEAMLNERADRAEDAVHAVRSAMEEGVVPGGGVSWIRAYNDMEIKRVKNKDISMGHRIIMDACFLPINALLNNSGYDTEKKSAIIEEISASENGSGYNLLTGEMEDLMKTGIVDPVKVLRCAIENACTVATQIMRTGAAMHMDYESNGLSRN